MSGVMLAAYRHDAHKFTGESHNNAREEFAVVRVNQSIPKSADGDAAALSRPQQKQDQTFPTLAADRRDCLRPRQFLSVNYRKRGQRVDRY